MVCNSQDKLHLKTLCKGFIYAFSIYVLKWVFLEFLRGVLYEFSQAQLSDNVC